MIIVFIIQTNVGAIMVIAGIIAMASSLLFMDHLLRSGATMDPMEAINVAVLLVTAETIGTVWDHVVSEVKGDIDKQALIKI